MNNVLLTSSNGNFYLYHRSGISLNNTPIEELRVQSLDLADKYVVEIRLESDYPDFDGKPKKIVYHNVYIARGTRSSQDTLVETKEYIELLNEAVDFVERINNYLDTNEEWKE